MRTVRWKRPELKLALLRGEPKVQRVDLEADDDELMRLCDLFGLRANLERQYIICGRRGDAFDRGDGGFGIGKF
jgi:hypothetical protein